MTPVTLEAWQQLAQITFYGFTAALALLTYRSAKRGLLNTVNTEYQKRAMDRIQQVSDQLLAEFDLRSPDHWSNDWPLDRYISPIFEAFDAHQKGPTPRSVFTCGIPDSRSLARLRNLQLKVTSDPFLPEPARSVIVAHLQRRHDLLFQAWLSIFGQYIRELAVGEHGISRSVDTMTIGSRLLKAIEERGCTPQEVEDQVHQVRRELQDYLESFDPFPGRKLKRRRAEKRQIVPEKRRERG